MNQKKDSKDKKDRGWTEFDCPECSAHNPWDEGFQVGDQLFCNWCGGVLIVKRVVDDPTRFKIVMDK
jgi:DNA-directed RNA polymerase subunit RPC12/RpoP